MLPAAVFSLSSSDTFPPCKQCIRKVDTKSKYNLTFAKNVWLLFTHLRWIEPLLTRYSHAQWEMETLFVLYSDMGTHMTDQLFPVQEL